MTEAHKFLLLSSANRLSGTEFKLYTYFVAMPEATPNLKLLQSYLGTSQSGLVRAIKRLETKGMIRVTRAPSMRNVYYVQDPSQWRSA